MTNRAALTLTDLHVYYNYVRKMNIFFSIKGNGYQMKAPKNGGGTKNEGEMAKKQAREREREMT